MSSPVRTTEGHVTIPGADRPGERAASGGGSSGPKGRLRAMKVGMVIAILVALPSILGALPTTVPDNFPIATLPTLINNIIIAGIAAAAFSVLIGTAGQVSVAQEAFLIIGSIASGYIGPVAHASMFFALPAAFVAGLVVGAIVGLPALRLSSVYLLVATIGFDLVGEYVFQVFQDHISLSGVTYAAPTVPTWLAWMPGLHSGRSGLPINTEYRWYWLLVVLAVLSFCALRNFVRGPHGRSLSAVRTMDERAQLLGVDVVRSKLVVFSLTSAFVSLAGALTAYHTGFVSTDSFNIGIVLQYALMVAIGGFGSVGGAFVGAAVVLALPFVLNWLFQNVAPFSNIPFLSRYGSDIEQIVFGVVLITVLLLQGRSRAMLKRLGAVIRPLGPESVRAATVNGGR